MFCPFPYRVPIRKIGHLHQSTRFPFACCIQYLPRSARWMADTGNHMGAAPQRILIGMHNASCLRIRSICRGVSPTTIYSMLNAMSQNLGIVSIQKICDGLEISVRDFFDDPVLRILIRS